MIQNRIDLPRDWPSQHRPFFNRAAGRTFDVKNAEEVTEINLYDEIGFFGVSAAQMRRLLDQVHTAKVLLRINSPGGDVFDGIAIHNDLQAHPAEVTVRVTGIAASAASLIAMAGDRIEMFGNAFLMIHNAWALAIGDKQVMRDLADTLEQIDGALASTYAQQTGKTAKEIGKMMDAETWLNGEKAVEQGFADAVVSGAPDAKARFDLSGFRNLPRELDTAEPIQPYTIRDLERSLRDAGYSRSSARELAARAHHEGAALSEPLRDAGTLDRKTRAAFERLIAAIAA